MKYGYGINNITEHYVQDSLVSMAEMVKDERCREVN